MNNLARPWAATNKEGSRRPPCFQTFNLARQGRNQTCREWQVACGKWQAKKSSRLATKFRPSSTERTEHLRDLSVELLETRRPRRTSHWLLSYRSSRL